MTFGVPVAALQAIVSVEGDTIAAAKLEAFGAKIDTTAAKTEVSAAKQVASSKEVGTAFQSLDRQLGSFGGPFGTRLGQVGRQLESVEQDGAHLSTGLLSTGNAAIAGAAGLGIAAAE